MATTHRARVRPMRLGLLLLVLALALMLLTSCTPEQWQASGQRIKEAAPVVEKVVRLVSPPAAKAAGGATVGIGEIILALGTLFVLWRAESARRKAKGAHKRQDAAEKAKSPQT